MTADSGANPPQPYREVRAAVLPATIWRVERQAGGSSIDPDGCMDLIWTGRTLLVAGPDTVANLAATDTTATVTGIRFDPGCAPAVLGVSAADLRDVRVPARDIWTGNEIERLAERLHESPTPGADLERWCAAHTRGVTPEWVGVAVDALRAGTSVADCARTVGMTERSLHRQSLRYFGYGPKTLGRILRMRSVTALLSTPGAGSLSDVAARCGYADYAHMYREVRALTGRAPSSHAAGTHVSAL